MDFLFTITVHFSQLPAAAAHFFPTDAAYFKLYTLNIKLHCLSLPPPDWQDDDYLEDCVIMMNKLGYTLNIDAGLVA